MKFTKFIVALQTLMMVSTPLFSLSAPSNLTLSNITEESITLNWTDTSNDETGFKIYRNGSLIYQTAPNITTYTDSGLYDGIDYTYMVKATNNPEPSSVWISSGTYEQTKRLYASLDSPTLYLDRKYFDYKTSDAGLTWQSSNNTEIANLPYNLTMDKLRLISSDEQIPNENGYPVGAMDIIADGVGNYYVATYYFNVYKVLADGTWIKLTIDDDSSQQTFHSSPNALLYDKGILYVGTYWSGVHKYEDGAWSHMSNGLPEGRGINGIQKTSDGTLYTVVSDQKGGQGVFRYNAATNQWEDVNYGLSDMFKNHIINIEINSDDDIFINVLYHGIYKKNKDHNSWLNTQLYQGNIIPIEIEKIVTTSNGDVFALSGGDRGAGAGPFGGRVFISKDNGKTWRDYNENIKTEDDTIKDLVVDNNDTLYVSSYFKPIYKRALTDKKWRRIFYDDHIYSTPGIMATDLSNNNVYFGTYYSGVYQNIAGNTPFKAINTGLPSPATVQRIVAANNMLFAEINNNIWTTSAEEINWHMLPEFTGFELYIMNDILYVGTSNGVYIYDNGNWNTFNDGLPDGLGVYTFTHRNNTIYIGTSNGVYFKTGENPWQHIDNTGLNHTKVISIAISFDGSYLYAGTEVGFNRYKLQD